MDTLKPSQWTAEPDLQSESSTLAPIGEGVNTLLRPPSLPESDAQEGVAAQPLQQTAHRTSGLSRHAFCSSSPAFTERKARRFEGPGFYSESKMRLPPVSPRPLPTDNTLPIDLLKKTLDVIITSANKTRKALCAIELDQSQWTPREAGLEEGDTLTRTERRKRRYKIGSDEAVVEAIKNLVAQITAYNTLINRNPQAPQPENCLPRELCRYIFPNGCIESHAVIPKIAAILSHLEMSAIALKTFLDPAHPYTISVSVRCCTIL